MFHIAVKNQIGDLDELTAELDRYCETELADEGTGTWLNLIVEELFVNFVHHGTKDTGRFELSVECCDDSLELTLKDDGKPFNPLEAQPANVEASLEDRQVGRLGLHLVRKLSSSIAYERAEGCNIVKLTIPRSAAE